MSHLIINGGKKLQGEIVNQSAKNSAVAILCACCAIRGRTSLVAVPEIEEVNRIIELIRSIGVKVEMTGKGNLTVDASGDLDLSHIDRSASEKTRSSLMLMGALASREKKYKIFKSGGCKLGQRTVKPHIFALEKFGVEVESKDGYYEIKNNLLRPAHLVMYESGDTATENAIMAAAQTVGETVIKMASANYMVQDLCHFLVRAGARIDGIGTTTLKIHGVEKLTPVENYSIMPDPIVAMTYIAAAIVTRSHLTITNCPLEFLELELVKLEKMGQKFKLKNNRLSVGGNFEIVDIEILPSDLVAPPDKIDGRPFPGLNLDNLPLFIPILAMAEGRTLVHDWAYENRAMYSFDLLKLGARVTVLDPHRVFVEGPSELKAAEIIAPPALRPAVNVLICMLGAKGQSILRNTYEIDRGYENLYETLNIAGADIKIVDDNI
ncbi:MAG: UDP-N-acetylglucosamine 1-carboxyvinyltransferase [Candidatus Magasanikbacteria bacterium]